MTLEEHTKRVVDSLERTHSEQWNSIMWPVMKYDSRPFSPWKGEMVYSETLQQFFQNPDELLDYLRDKGLEIPEDLRLVICEPERWRLLDSDYWYDDAEYFGADIPEELEDAIEALNNVIRSLPAAYWYPGPYRTEMPCTR